MNELFYKCSACNKYVMESGRGGDHSHLRKS